MSPLATAQQRIKELERANSNLQRLNVTGIYHSQKRISALTKERDEIAKDREEIRECSNAAIQRNVGLILAHDALTKEVEEARQEQGRLAVVIEELKRSGRYRESQVAAAESKLSTLGGQFLDAKQARAISENAELKLRIRLSTLEAEKAEELLESAKKRFQAEHDYESERKLKAELQTAFIAQAARISKLEEALREGIAWIEQVKLNNEEHRQAKIVLARLRAALSVEAGEKGKNG